MPPVMVSCIEGVVGDAVATDEETTLAGTFAAGTFAVCLQHSVFAATCLHPHLKVEIFQTAALTEMYDMV